MFKDLLYTCSSIFLLGLCRLTKGNPYMQRIFVLVLSRVPICNAIGLLCYPTYHPSQPYQPLDPPMWLWLGLPIDQRCSVDKFSHNHTALHNWTFSLAKLVQGHNILKGGPASRYIFITNSSIGFYTKTTVDKICVH